MTVREVLGILRNVRELYIGYDGGCTTVNPKDGIIAGAFGDYVVGGVYAMGEDSFEIDIMVRPIKATELEDK